MEVTNETQQRKKHSWYVRDPETRDAVKYCVMMRLSEKESLEELSQRGHPICDRTFRRIKSKLEPNKQRLDKIVTQDILLRVKIAVETLESLQERLFQMRKNSPNSSEEIKIISEIRKISKEIFEFYDSYPVIASLLKLEKKKRNGNVEEPR